MWPFRLFGDLNQNVLELVLLLVLSFGVDCSVGYHYGSKNIVMPHTIEGLDIFVQGAVVLGFIFINTILLRVTYVGFGIR